MEIAYQLPYPVYQDTLLICRNFLVNEQTASDFSKITTFPSRNNYAASLGSNQIVYAGYGVSDSLRDDYKGLNVQGKIVLLKSGYPKGYIQHQVTGKNI